MKGSSENDNLSDRSTRCAERITTAKRISICKLGKTTACQSRLIVLQYRYRLTAALPTRRRASSDSLTKSAGKNRIGKSAGKNRTGKRIAGSRTGLAILRQRRGSLCALLSATFALEACSPEA